MCIFYYVQQCFVDIFLINLVTPAQTFLYQRFETITGRRKKGISYSLYEYHNKLKSLQHIKCGPNHATYNHNNLRRTT